MELHFETGSQVDVKESLKKRPLCRRARCPGLGGVVGPEGEAWPAGCLGTASPTGASRRCLETMQQCLPSSPGMIFFEVAAPSIILFPLYYVN